MNAPKTKRWSVNAVADGQAPLKFFSDGRLLSADAPVENVSPVEHLLIAVAGCYALSVRAVLARRKLPRTAFEVVATGDKADGPVSRLARLSVIAIFQTGMPDEEASAISAEAKSVCTVTNTLVTPPVIGYGVHSLREQRAPAMADPKNTSAG